MKTTCLECFNSFLLAYVYLLKSLLFFSDILKVKARREMNYKFAKKAIGRQPLKTFCKAKKER